MSFLFIGSLFVRSVLWKGVCDLTSSQKKKQQIWRPYFKEDAELLSVELLVALSEAAFPWLGSAVGNKEVLSNMGSYLPLAEDLRKVILNLIARKGSIDFIKDKYREVDKSAFSWLDPKYNGVIGSSFCTYPKANAVAVGFLLCLSSIWPITAGPKINQFFFVLRCG